MAVEFLGAESGLAQPGRGQADRQCPGTVGGNRPTVVGEGVIVERIGDRDPGYCSRSGGGAGQDGRVAAAGLDDAERVAAVPPDGDDVVVRAVVDLEGAAGGRPLVVLPLDIEGPLR